MIDSNPVSTPSEKRAEEVQDSPLEESVPYRQAVVCIVSEVLDCPKKSDWQAVKRIFKYLNGTKEYGLFYKSDTKLKLDCYSDSDFANDNLSRRSRTGFLMTCGTGAISWLSRKQPNTATALQKQSILQHVRVPRRWYGFSDC
ncbi:uncharacterized protein [Halyomorpha halys]|uniref:uncharacterized protein n=1 Tax=Halyomorpha halys TaxID=286706 RepID=UPI0006D4CD37|nr:uncharacterized protein LOC106685541 [Halyomorpha halys]